MRFFRQTVPVTLVAYLLATMGIIGTHDHHHGPASASVVAPADVCEHSHAHQHGTHSHTHSHGSHSHHHHAEPDGVATTDGATSDQHCPGCPSHGPLEDDDCAVCKMLSAKLLAPAQVTLVGLIEQVAEMRLQAVSAPTAPFDGLPLSRGPPARG